MTWTIKVVAKAKKQVAKLPPDIRELYFALAFEIKKLGPARTGWHHYGKIKGATDCHHCHLTKGRPTYVAVWKVTNKTTRIVEVRYVGTHEKANYQRLC